MSAVASEKSVKKLTAKVLVSAAVGAGLMFAVVGCQGESKEEAPTTTTTTTTTTTPPASEAPLAPTTKGSLEPLQPGPGDINPTNVGPGE